MNRYAQHTLLFSAWMLALVACTSRGEEEVLRVNRGRAQGTTYSVSYKVPSGIDYQKSIDSILIAVDRSMSAWSPKSTINRINSGNDSVADRLMYVVLERGLYISRQTDGAFDVTVSPLMNLWGFGADSTARQDSAAVDSVMKLVGYKKIKLDPNGLIHRPKGMQFDVNAIAQGYTVDLIAAFLVGKGVGNYLVEVGGEMIARGTNLRDEAWVVGIDKPSEEIEETRFQLIIHLDNRALATSGNYRKFKVDEATGQKYGHTINPKTGYPARDRLLSVSILAKSAMDADAYATACMVMGLDKAQKFIEAHPELDAYFVYSGLSGEWETWSSPGFETAVK